MLFQRVAYLSIWDIFSTALTKKLEEKDKMHKMESIRLRNALLM